MTEKVAPTRSVFAVSDRWANRDQVVFGRLWFEFLLFSPSYELARKYRVSDLDDVERQRLPNDFEMVLSVFDDLGDVQRLSFDEWWFAKGIRYFGYKGEQPSVLPIEALLPETPDPLDRLSRRAAKYVEGRWHEQGQPASMIISVPIGIPKARAMDQISDILAQTPESRKHVTSGPPKYAIHGKKRDLDSLFRYIKCVVCKAYFPEAKLWEIGVEAKLSSTYSERLAKGQGSVEDQQALKILTSRALHRAMTIAENAARGIFPSYIPCVNAVGPNWTELSEIFESREDWEDERT